MPPSRQEIFQSWLQGVVNWESASAQAATDWVRERPIVLIGLGDTGLKTLTHIANYLQGRCGPNWPALLPHVQLLHVGVSPEDSLGQSSQTDLGFRSVVIGLDRDRRRRMSWHEGLDWCSRDRLHNPGRALGRLALFADLAEGKAQSRLWKSLDASIRDLRDVSVYIVADAFSDESSGMIADVAHLLRTIRPNQIYRMGLCLALQNARWPDELSPGERNERTFATLRELQRLQRKSRVEWRYAPGLGQPELDTTSEVPLFDEMIVMDGKGEGSYDLSQWTAEDGILASLAGGLIALLDKDISDQFYQLWINQASQPVRRGDVPREFVVGSFGCYALRLPVEEMCRVLASRLVHALVFDREQGLIRWNELDDQGELRRHGDVEVPTIDKSDVYAFLDARGLTKESARRLRGDTVRRHLYTYLEHMLNIERVPHGLRWAEEFFKKLKDILPEWNSELEKMGDALHHWIAAVGEVSKPESHVNDDLYGDFLKVSELPSSSTSASEFDTGPLYDRWEADWNASRQVMARAERLHAHKLLWRLEDEARLFKQNLAAQRAWQRIRDRIWWRWFEQGGVPQLGMVVPPLDLDGSDPRTPHRTVRESIALSTPAHVFTVDRPDVLLAELTKMAQQLAGESLRGEQVGFHLEDSPEAYARDLELKATPLCRRRSIPRHWPIGVESFLYFAGPDQARVDAIARSLEDSFKPRSGTGGGQTGGPRHHFHRLETDDPTECRLLHVKHVLPIYTIDGYAIARSSYSPKEKLHIWKGERTVVEWEETGRNKVSPEVWDRKVAQGGSGIQFSPQFVDLISQDEDGMRLFGQTLLYGVIELDEESLIVSCGEIDLETVSGQTVGRAAEAFLSRIREAPEVADRLAEEIADRRPSDYGAKIKRLDEIRYDVIHPLSTREEILAQDVALLLAKTMADEEYGDEIG